MAFDNELSATSVPARDPYSPFRATVVAQGLNESIEFHLTDMKRGLLCGRLYWRLYWFR